ncbi:Acetyltransferase (GNAT) domain-containing protein [Cellulosimicrobium aquatile]|uniref:Acetyltransferase (GNAT) domain-containing protein n=1 Tax=Cellulosimicrobium aquatile TaxID=1612203 RepID=A0A1N6SNB2_9MICO|nr:GNAT family N-acetyltransferase [Cellulosimicrobium aquatile]SIQ42559.1 Acetyltransferase (GNAT) domain-containing protein [Cellulosimicrobium aquatile]
MTAFRLRDATAQDADAASGLALRSKASWGYSAPFLEACRSELTFTSKQCSGGGMRIAEQHGRIIGFALVEPAGSEPELSALFVDPEHMGRGVGHALLVDALGAARRLGLHRLFLDSDPGAEPFYRRHGAWRVGETPSGSVAGRVIPRLCFDLARIETSQGAGPTA